MAEERIVDQVLNSYRQQYDQIASRMLGLAPLVYRACFQEAAGKFESYLSCSQKAGAKANKLNEQFSMQMHFLQLTVGRCLEDGQNETTCHKRATTLAEQLLAQFN